MVTKTRHKLLPPKPGKEHQFIRLAKRPGPETINEALAGPFDGAARQGFLKGNIIRKPDYVVHEDLSAEEKAQKKQLQVILGSTIEPNALSAKSSPAMDKRSLVTKLGKMTLAGLLRLVPDSIRVMTSDELAQIAGGTQPLSEDVKAEIQTLYLDVSP